MSIPVRSAFGMRVHPTTGAWQHHDGLDIALPTGTEVVASRGGVVVRIDRDGIGQGIFNGNAVQIRDATGYLWRYLHLSRVLVVPGQLVAAGQAIGAIGGTGRTTGPHLHFQVNTPQGQAVDPTRFFPSETFRRVA